MSGWKPKRFWKSAQVVAEGDAFTVTLDGRPIRTPGKAPLLLPSRAMAVAVAAEWDDQGATVDPRTMPFTRSANSAIDKVAPRRAEVAEMLAAYGDADLLCYRAPEPEALVARQAALWDPLLERAARELRAPLAPRTGVVHLPQAPEALAALSARVHAMDPFQLAGFHDLVSLSGSLVLGFAAALDWQDPDALWTLSRLDELWQEEQWGADDEAQAAAEVKRQAFLHAKRFFDAA